MNIKKVKAFLLSTPLMLSILLITAIIVAKIIMPLAVGRGREVIVPSLIGYDVQKAQKICTKSRIHLDIVPSYEYSNDFDKGKIIRQRPRPENKIKQDGSVKAFVSKGPRLIEIPYLTNKSIPEAIDILLDLNLQYALNDSTYSDQIPKNYVITSVPPSGNRVKLKSNVKLTISRGRKVVIDSLLYKDNKTEYPENKQMDSLINSLQKTGKQERH
ncbi:MAG: PASTA domain-containing protein [Candidatus Zophobacter franzmannii]|nr:PASTA domain-containing protein [Candidatus Zophobacter franzmannii]